MANYNFVQSSGIIVVDASDLRTQVENEFRAALGQDLITTSDTPQGRLIDAEVLARRAALETVASVANQINPRYSQGVFLESLCSFLDLDRDPETQSRLAGVLVTGVPFSTIPRGSLARDQSGYTWSIDGNTLLDQDGQATTSFTCTSYGPIQCATGDLNRVASNIVGWETVNNPAPAIVGELTQSDQSLRRQRENTLAKLGTSDTFSIISQLYDAPVLARSVIWRENITDQQQTIDGITMPPHSLWTCVQGGQVADIAKVLLRTKTIGAQWVGDIQYDITEDNSGQVYPVRFDRPKEVDIDIQVEVLQGNFTGSAVQAVTDAILSYADGDIGNFDGFTVRNNYVSPTTIATAVRQVVTGIEVFDLKVKRHNDDTFGCSPLQLDVGEVPATARGYIKVSVKT